LLNYIIPPLRWTCKGRPMAGRTLTDLLSRLPDATRRDASEWDNLFWRGVSQVAWDEEGQVVNLQENLPRLLWEAQRDLVKVTPLDPETVRKRTGVRRFWEAYDEVVEEERQEFLAGYPTLYDPRTGQCFVPRRDYKRNRKDEKYRWMQAEWICKQLRYEEVDFYDIVPDERWNAMREKLRYHGIKNRNFPRKGSRVVASKLGSVRLPDDLEERVELIDNWIASIPDERRIGGNGDFGGEKYKGLEPRSEKKYIFLKWHIGDVAARAEQDGMMGWKSADGKALGLKAGRTEEERKKATQWVRETFLE
jgi:hypothetical protein